MRSLLPPNLVALLLVAMAGLTLLIPGPALIDGGWRLLGCVPATIGLVVSVAGSKLFERVGTNIKTFDDPDELVTSGLFGISRNPMYLGFTILLVGVAIIFGSWLAFGGPVVFLVAADRWYIPYEERRMHAVFGRRYEHYCRSVRRWIGRRRVGADPRHEEMVA